MSLFALLRNSTVVVLPFLGACRVPPALTGASRPSCPATDATSQAVASVPLPGRAFKAIPTSDGCWVFVSMNARPDGTGSGVAVVRRIADGGVLTRTIPGPPAIPRFGVPGAFGMGVTQDGNVLIVAALDRLSFYDVGRLTSGAGDPLLGTLPSVGEPSGFFSIGITADDRLLFATNHNDSVITIVDLAATRRSAFNAVVIIGRIPVGYGPSGLAFSSDQHYLYATSQIALAGWGWPNACKAPGAGASAAPNHRRGALHVIDVARAVVDPSRSVVATVPAGCDPVRVVTSTVDNRAYVTARSDNVLLAFDTGRLISDSAHALIGTVTTHTGPVGIALLGGGRRVVVTNSPRFAGSSTDTAMVTIVDANAIGTGRNATVTSVALIAGPLELTPTRDGRTLLLTGFESQRLVFLNVTKAPFSERAP